MLLRGDESYGELGVLPGLALTYAAVPTLVRFRAPWGEDIMMPLSVTAQCEMATEGAVLVPVVHLQWSGLPMPGVCHTHNLLLRLQW